MRTIEPGIRKRIGHRHPGQRHVAGVRHRDRIVDHVAGRVGRAASAAGHARHILHDVQRRSLGNRHRRVVGVRTGLVAVRRRNVAQLIEQAVGIRAVKVAARINFSLRHRVRRRVAPGLADLEQVVLVADHVDGVAHDRARIRKRIGHRHPGQRHVAGVRHRDRIVDHVAGQSAAPPVPPVTLDTSFTMFSAGVTVSTAAAVSCAAANTVPPGTSRATIKA